MRYALRINHSNVNNCRWSKCKNISCSVNCKRWWPSLPVAVMKTSVLSLTHSRHVYLLKMSIKHDKTKRSSQMKMSIVKLLLMSSLLIMVVIQIVTTINKLALVSKCQRRNSLLLQTTIMTRSNRYDRVCDQLFTLLDAMRRKIVIWCNSLTAQRQCLQDEWAVNDFMRCFLQPWYVILWGFSYAAVRLKRQKF